MAQRASTGNDNGNDNVHDNGDAEADDDNEMRKEGTEMEQESRKRSA